ncbi:hypothetical protein N7540_005839 [Penicillium herquei]|nr:hypothetical protein N7540_005839 [Penicillium herquei]
MTPLHSSPNVVAAPADSSFAEMIIVPRSNTRDQEGNYSTGIFILTQLFGEHGTPLHPINDILKKDCKPKGLSRNTPRQNPLYPRSTSEFCCL